MTTPYDEAAEALRKKFVKLQRFSFLLDDDGNVRRVPDQYGNWVNFQEAHVLFELVEEAVAEMRAEKAITDAKKGTT